ncbi:MAG: Uncharacterized protein FD147_986 [Chloroflexi bacterium]|nr:MAG: Uncharacterized protein FD147_986 [Chloroflexota bacterium]
MAVNSQKSNWFIDVLMFAGFLAAFFLSLTGLVIHQWLGVALLLLIVIHFINHWNWVKCVAERFFGKTSNRARLYALIDGILFFGVVMIMETGLVISTWFNLELSNYSAWRDLHVYASLATLLVTVLKIGLHWRWVAGTAGKIFNARKPQAKPRVTVPQVLKPVPQSASIDRRQFLVTMGIVGLGSLLAINNVLSKETIVQSASLPEEEKPADNNAKNQELTVVETQVAEVQIQDNATQPAATDTTYPQSTPAPVNVVAAPATTPCTVRCSKHCSFPGRCNRYVDSNNNRLCDLGECM